MASDLSDVWPDEAPVSIPPPIQPVSARVARVDEGYFNPLRSLEDFAKKLEPERINVVVLLLCGAVAVLALQLQRACERIRRLEASLPSRIR